MQDVTNSCNYLIRILPRGTNWVFPITTILLQYGNTIQNMMHTLPTNKLQNILRILLGVFMVIAAIGHFTFQRSEFQAQVPNWIPFSKDLVVILSGVVELGLGLSMIFWKRERVRVGIALALFYVLVFPGNIAQYINGINAFGLNSDKARLIRLCFQPVLVLCAVWSTGALKYFFYRKRGRSF